MAIGREARVSRPLRLPRPCFSLTMYVSCRLIDVEASASRGRKKCKRQLLTVDLLAHASMKNAASCDK